MKVMVGAATTTFSPPGSAYLVQDSDCQALARYTSSLSLLWEHSDKQLTSGDDWSYQFGTLSRFAIAPNGDIVVGYQKKPPSGPGSTTPYYRLARFRGSDATRLWELQFSDPGNIYSVLSRPERGDFLAFDKNGSSCHQVPGDGTETTLLGAFYGIDAAVGSDGATVWIWGGGPNSGQSAFNDVALNPWSSETWDVGGNPQPYSGSDAFLLGARDDGTTIGPWLTEGDWTVDLRAAVEPTGDLIVVARTYGPVRFNGNQPLAEEAGNRLFRLRHTDGVIQWMTALGAEPTAFVVSPRGYVIVLFSSSSSYSLAIYSTADGSLMSQFETGQPARLVAAGPEDLYVVGVAESSADFDPGTGSDLQGEESGVFISHYRF